ncbi:MAG: zinc-binding dehydrogenase [Halieaceae bacterium]|jgi:NADPH:quinone reductase-like Zn-dependent oxidoreductase|nr:zinc-binding dehydrogenase [Halieaceae bacterium]
MTITTRQLRSALSEEGVLRLGLEEVSLPEPAAHEVLVRVEASPINPSDLGLLFGAADMSTARFSGSPEAPVVEADVPAAGMRMMAGRVGLSLPVGNEGAGTVIAAGSSDEAQALLGKTVGVYGGELYAEHRVLPAAMCLPLNEGATAEQGASCFVNPMTALGMTETMRMEGHKALIHTAAASNLGQMLNRICIADGIDLVNIVRREDQAQILRDLGAKHIANSASDDFAETLQAALRDTGATLAFDAIGGGRLVSDIFSAMERVAVSKMDEYSRYGSATFKQVYIYGSLDFAPTTLQRNFGFAWSLSGWLLPNFLARAGAEVMARMRARVADELTTTFASHYSQRISLAQALSPEAMAVYGRQATGEKFLIEPQR